MRNIAGRLKDRIVKMLPEGARMVADKYEGAMREGIKAARQRSAEGRKQGGVMAESILNPKAARDIGKEVSEQTRVSREIFGETPIPGETFARGAAAFGDRLIQDVMSDGTRRPYWRYNNPIPIGESIGNKMAGKRALASEEFIGKGGKLPSGEEQPAYPLFKRAIQAAPVLGAFLTAGHFDLTNPGELFRPKGFKQNYTEKGGPYTQTNQLVPEAIERFAFARRGKPLKYEDAKAEIPELTKQQYGDFMRYKYQDRGITGLGLIKGTRRNLEGNPELSIVGFPVSPAMMGSFAGAAGGRFLAGKHFGNRPGPGLALSALGTAAGAIAGYGAGRLINMDLARQGRPDPMTTQEYNQAQGL